MTSEAVVDTFRQSLRGRLIQQGDADYDASRAIYNAMIDKRPRFIVHCADVADVILAVNFARENRLLTAVRSGGHNGAGLSLCDDGLVIDLSGLRGIRVDPVTRTVRVEPGCSWGDVDHATHAFGLATPSGVISTTGVSGLTLGGGHGYLTRKYGLTIDNLLAADVVLASGELVTASEEKNADLFWALRGGGGNFGIVTSFLFRLHPVTTVHAGPMFWPMEQAADVMRGYRDLIREAPEDLYGFFAFLTIPPAPPFPENLHGRKMCGIIWCILGDASEADKNLESMRRIASPEFEHIGPMPYPMLQGLFDAFYPPGLQWYWKGDFIKELTDEAIAKHLEHAAKLPTPLSTMHLYPVNGAVHRKKQEDTAFSYRDVTWSKVIAGIDSDPLNAENIIAWARQYWEALHPHSAGGSYVNFMMEEGEDRVKATYGGNYQRLVEIKNKYDPKNFFRVNQNIAPTV